jgi:hypothetical protein
MELCVVEIGKKKGNDLGKVLWKKSKEIEEAAVAFRRRRPS